MDPAGFASDIASKPVYLKALSDRLQGEDPWAALPEDVRRVLFVGMGSSAYAAGVTAARLQARGFEATSVLASSDLLPRPRESDVIIAISAGGSSPETMHAIDHYRGRSALVLLTNTLESPLRTTISDVVEMSAGPEVGGVACRSFQHTLVLLLALERHLLGLDRDLPELVRAASDASEDLIGRADRWLPTACSLLDGPDGIHVAAPARRLSSAQQSALMLREGPRRQAYACETGDWSHVDVYLTKSTDYRLLLFGGSMWEPQLLEWIAMRGSVVVGVGQDIPDARLNIRYNGDDDDDVRLLTEVLVAELLASDIWLRQ